VDNISDKTILLEALRSAESADELIWNMGNEFRSRWKNDRKFLLDVMEYAPIAFICANEELQNDETFRKEAVKRNVNVSLNFRIIK